MTDGDQQDDLRAMVERIVLDVCPLPTPGLEYVVDRIETEGDPIRIVRVWSTLHFLKSGSPFCCQEPGCHFGVFEDQLDQIGLSIQRALGLREKIAVEFVDEVSTAIEDGVEFTAHQ